MHIIGLMAGTSTDGIDAALVDIRGSGRRMRLDVLNSCSLRFQSDMRNAILRLCDPRTGSIPDLCVLNALLGEQFADAARAVVKNSGIDLSDVAAIASHGQTVWHQPDSRFVGGLYSRGTLQIGDPAVIAARTGCRVVSGFRSADMAAGGQGAPLVPYADWALFSSRREARAVQNIGGIANVTYLPHGAKTEDVVAFDTGPGNLVIDGIVQALTNGDRTFDEGGAWAAYGTVDDRLLRQLLRHPYYQLPPPKSTGREMFGEWYAIKLMKMARKARVNESDLLATVTMLTAETISRAYTNWLMPLRGVRTVIVGGGGVHNSTLMNMLRQLLMPARVISHEEFGIPDDAKEAVAFAILAYETLHGRPSNVPAATGARRQVVLGSVTPAP